MAPTKTWTPPAGPAPERNPDFDLDEYLAEVDLTDAVKRQIRDRLHGVGILDVPGQPRRLAHAIFTGNSGTGKTTAVKVLARAAWQRGLLSRPLVHEVSRADLVGDVVGATEARTLAAFDAAEGGILFIDEAHQLLKPDAPFDFGAEAIKVIIRESEARRGRVTLIMAGYGPEMERLLKADQGFRSRMADKWVFPDIPSVQLAALFADFVVKGSVAGVSVDARAEVERRAIEDSKQPGFGNARWARELADQAVRRLSTEIADNAAAEPTVQPWHVTPPATPEVTVAEVLAEIRALDGVDGLEAWAERVAAVSQANTGRDPSQRLPIPTCLAFVGPPGTGKTTAAPLAAKLLHAAGVLRTAELHVKTGNQLESGYVGQTKDLVDAALDDARAAGGGLLIDEAYGMVDSRGSGNSFKADAVTQLVGRLQGDPSMCVIVAGYAHDIAALMEMNEGLPSRFSTTITFKAWSPERLAKHITTAVKGKGFAPADPESLVDACKQLVQHPGYASGRTGGTFAGALMTAHVTAAYSMQTEPTFTLTEHDVQAALKSTVDSLNDRAGE